MKTFGPLSVPKKPKPSDTFDRDLFVRKVSEGILPVDAVKIAGYTGTSPASYAQQMLKKPSVKKDLGDIFERKAKLALRKMTPQKADQMSYLQLSQAAASMYDKARLARGESTSNTAHIHVNVSALSDEELERYLEEKSRAASTGGAGS